MCYNSINSQVTDILKFCYPSICLSVISLAELCRYNRFIKQSKDVSWSNLNLDHCLNTTKIIQIFKYISYYMYFAEVYALQVLLYSIIIFIYIIGMKDIFKSFNTADR